MSPWAFERYSIPHAANADIHDAQAVSIHGNELVDLARHAFVEKILDPSEIAQAFFTDIRDERYGTRRLHLGLIQCLYRGQHHGQSTAIVADPGAFQDMALTRYFYSGFFRKHCVEVGAEKQIGAWGYSRPRTDHVAGFVNANIFEAKIQESLF